MRSLIMVVGLAAIAASATAQAPSSAPHAVIVLPEQTQWGAAPAILPKGAQVAVVDGNPAEAGLFTMRLKIPDGYRIPPHFHPVMEHVTVIQGTFQVGMGEVFDVAKLTDLPVGSFGALGPGVRHFAQARGETVIQLHGTGPWSLTYVNPADDPRSARP